jgi:hypothetical protein
MDSQSEGRSRTVSNISDSHPGSCADADSLKLKKTTVLTGKHNFIKGKAENVRGRTFSENDNSLITSLNKLRTTAAVETNAGSSRPRGFSECV